MSRRSVVLNALLILVSAVFAAYIGWKLTAPLPRPAPRIARAAAPKPTATASAAARPAAAYGMIASRNLFSPTRTEVTSPSPAQAALNVPKPNLYGVVLRDGAPVAYLEDPSTKRVAGYRVGDSVAGGSVKSIAADHVVLMRPEGQVDVRLRDPAKPRPAPLPSTPPPSQGLGVPVPPSSSVPATGVAPPTERAPVPPVSRDIQRQFPPQVQRPTPPPNPPMLPARRPLPPNLLRRVPPGPPTDAPER